MLHDAFDTGIAALRAIGLNNSTAARLAALATTETMRPLRITAIHGDWMTLHDGMASLRARALPRLLAHLAGDDDALAVGDWVAIDDLDGEPWIVLRAAPLTRIARRTEDGRRQVLASNIDTALLVMGLDLDFNLRRLERYVAVVRSAGIAPVVVLTKADIAAQVDDKVSRVEHRLPAGIAVVAVNGLRGEAALVLQPWLQPGQTVCLLGSSGAGKSTLANTLAGAAQQTAGIRQGDGRGRHTTTTRSLHRCAGGACLVDTPGLRAWQPDADGAALSATFDDIAALAGTCQFRDCRHELEPGCAVRASVDPDRLANYHKLLREARRAGQTPLDRIAERARWKVISKAAQRRMRDKRPG